MSGPGRWLTVDIGMVPWIGRYIAFHVRAIPGRDTRRLLDQRTQALIGGWIAANIQLVDIQDRGDPFNRLSRDGCPRAAELAQRGGGHEADQQAQDGDDDKQLE